MATNNNQTMLDLPFFELLNQHPALTTATSAMTSVEDGIDRFIYSLRDSNFYRYDCYGDTWQVLANPVIAPATGLALKYTKRRGFHGRIISATSTTVRIPAIRGNALNNKDLLILFGPGAGETRKLTFVRENIHDAGVISSMLGSNVGIQDSSKKWRVNQWVGYTLAITLNTGVSTYKKIIYNNTTDLFVADASLQPHDPWNNQAYVNSSPVFIPSNAAGAQAHYQIMSADFTVDSPWDETPDATSFFTTLTGGIYALSSTGGAPFLTLQYYDVINDMWQTKTVPQLLITGQGTDFSLERTGRLGNQYLANTGNVSATIRTLSDDGINVPYDRFANYRIEIKSGTGKGQHRRITAHTNNTFTLSRSWSTVPDNTSTYQVWSDFDRVYLSLGAYSSLFAYSADNDAWMQGQSFDDGIATNISASYGSWTPIGVSTGVRIAAGVTAINPVPTNAGTGYTIGDVLTHSTGGTGAQIRVKSIAVGGIVTELELVHTGTVTGFTTGSGKTVTGGTGTGLTFEIISVGATALITTNSNHWFKAGNVVTFAGCTEAAWNAQYTIVGVPAVNTFCVATPATANMAASVTQGTTFIYDSTKNWIPNEHAGRLVHLMSNSTAPSSQIRWIIGNSEKQLNVATISVASTGLSKYIIYDSKIFGVDDLKKDDDMKAYGWATGGNTTSLVDNTKNWIPGQWNNYFMRIEAGPGFANGRIQIANNTSNTLNFVSVQSFEPDTNTKYEIADSWGNVSVGSTTTITDNTKSTWTGNVWSGKRFKITAGAGTAVEGTITASAANTVTGSGFTTDTTSAYAILSPTTRGTGTQLIWNWGYNDENYRGRYIYSVRAGNTNTIDIYDISSGKWMFNVFFLPQNEFFNIGSSYCYDGENKIYMSRSNNNSPIRIFEFDMANNTLMGARTTPWLQNNVTIGNFMEIVDTPDGTIRYMYVLQNQGTLFARAMIF